MIHSAFIWRALILLVFNSLNQLLLVIHDLFRVDLGVVLVSQ